MWGVEFSEGTGNSLVCGMAEFTARKTWNGPPETYRVRFHPDVGMEIDKEADEGWKIVKRRAEAQDVEVLLPADYGWTYPLFMAAFTFWGEGYKRGYTQGEWRANERAYRREKKLKERLTDLLAACQTALEWIQNGIYWGEGSGGAEINAEEMDTVGTRLEHEIAKAEGK